MQSKKINEKRIKLLIVLDKIIKSKPDPKWNKLRKMSQLQFQKYLDNLYSDQLIAK
jgi:hypothetical protein